MSQDTELQQALTTMDLYDLIRVLEKRVANIEDYLTKVSVAAPPQPEEGEK